MRTRFNKWIAVLALLGLMVGIWLALPPKTPATLPVCILPQGTTAQGPAPLLDHFLYSRWRWLAKVTRMIVGPRRQIVLGIQFLESSETMSAIAREYALGTPLAESNNVAVWMPAASAWPGPRGAFKLVSAPRITTADRLAAMVSAGTFAAGFYAHLLSDTVDLTARAQVTGAESFAATVRARLSYNHILVLLDTLDPDHATNRTVMVVTADEIDAKGNKVAH
ncbi:MAG TPA: hypothetical protein VHB20_17080 [Verrucomicrobiae bacterium]|jgi:hypothetical protein|nr:hypothetical protein [Verrucomicrobiae bacterium]